MPLIRTKIKYEDILLENTKTLILDADKTRELLLEEEKEILGFSYKQVEELKSKYSLNKLSQKILENADEEWKNIKKNIESVEIFYEIVWSRVYLELMFLTNYFVQKLTNPNSFEIIYKNNERFDYWYKNNVKYVLLEKLKQFYIKVCYAYAKVSPINIFEKDFNYKSKEGTEIIEQSYLDDFELYLKYEWDNAYNYHINIFKDMQDKKRKSILFD